MIYTNPPAKIRIGLSEEKQKIFISIPFNQLKNLDKEKWLLLRENVEELIKDIEWSEENIPEILAN